MTPTGKQVNFFNEAVLFPYYKIIPFFSLMKFILNNVLMINDFQFSYILLFV